MTNIRETLETINRYRESIPVDVMGLAGALGVRVAAVFLPSNVSGRIEKGTDRFEIEVNARHSATRQRFTLAHLLGHLVLHRAAIGDGNVDDGSYRSDGSFGNNRIGPREETAANRFAVNLLMPSEAIGALECEGVRDAAEVASRLNVSEGAAAIRLSGTAYADRQAA